MTALHSGLLLTRLVMRRLSLAQVTKNGDAQARMTQKRVNRLWPYEWDISNPAMGPCTVNPKRKKKRNLHSRIIGTRLGLMGRRGIEANSAV